MAKKIKGNLLAANASDPLLMAPADMMRRGFVTGIIRLLRRIFMLGSTSFARFISPERRQDLDDPGAELWLLIGHNEVYENDICKGISFMVDRALSYPEFIL